MSDATKGQLDAVVDQALAMQPRGDSGLFQQRDRSLLEHPGTDPLQHIVAALPFDDDRLDAVPVEQLAK